METVVLTITPNAAYVVEPENTAAVQILDYGLPSVNVSNDLGTAASPHPVVCHLYGPPVEQ